MRGCASTLSALWLYHGCVCCLTFWSHIILHQLAESAQIWNEALCCRLWGEKQSSRPLSHPEPPRGQTTAPLMGSSWHKLKAPNVNSLLIFPAGLRRRSPSRLDVQPLAVLGVEMAKRGGRPAAFSTGGMHTDLVCLMKANCLWGDDKHSAVRCCLIRAGSMSSAVILCSPLTALASPCLLFSAAHHTQFVVGCYALWLL